MYSLEVLLILYFGHFKAQELFCFFHICFATNINETSINKIKGLRQCWGKRFHICFSCKFHKNISLKYTHKVQDKTLKVVTEAMPSYNIFQQ